MAIEKSELRAGTMKVGVDVVLLRNGGQFTVVKEPDGQRRTWQRGEFNLIAGPSAINMLIEAVMEQVIAIAAARVGWANPDRAARVNRGIGAPGHLTVTRQAERPRQVIVPAFGNACAIRRAVFGQKILIISDEKLRGQSPLFQVV